MKVIYGCDAYSPPQVISCSGQRGLRAGHFNEDGTECDLEQPRVRAKVMRKLKQEKPSLLIGSPMCTEAPAERVLRHMEFMCQLYRVQIEQGGYILHEDPASGHSWTSKCVNDLLNKPHGHHRHEPRVRLQDDRDGTCAVRLFVCASPLGVGAVRPVHPSRRDKVHAELDHGARGHSSAMQRCTRTNTRGTT